MIQISKPGRHDVRSRGAVAQKNEIEDIFSKSVWVLLGVLSSLGAFGAAVIWLPPIHPVVDPVLAVAALLCAGGEAGAAAVALLEKRGLNSGILEAARSLAKLESAQSTVETPAPETDPAALKPHGGGFSSVDEGEEEDDEVISSAAVWRNGRVRSNA